MTLHWIAEKFRRSQQIKEELSKGTYQVDSDKVAKAIVDNADIERDRSDIRH